MYYGYINCNGLIDTSVVTPTGKRRAVVSLRGARVTQADVA